MPRRIKGSNSLETVGSNPPCVSRKMESGLDKIRRNSYGEDRREILDVLAGNGQDGPDGHFQFDGFAALDGRAGGAGAAEQAGEIRFAGSGTRAPANSHLCRDSAGV